jgi:hypothetical protein
MRLPNNKYIDQALNDPNAIWESLGVEAIPENNEPYVAIAVGLAFKEYDEAALGRALMQYGQAHILRCAGWIEYMEKGVGWYKTLDEYLASGESDIGEIISSRSNHESFNKQNTEDAEESQVQGDNGCRLPQGL